MEFRYLGHACFQVTAEGKHIVFDPFIRGNTLAAEAGVTIDDVKADYILVSHGHSDHTGDLLYLAEKTGATVVSSFEICTWLNKQGYAHTHPMNIGGKWAFDFGTVKMTFASHSSSLDDGTYAGEAAGFLLRTERKTIYYSGDTGLNAEMKLIGELNKIDLALLPVGDNFTMGVEDACLAADFIRCRNIIGMHFDTFGFIKIDHDAAKAHFKQHEKMLHLLSIGERIVI
jgi:L-ascorbate metabolism protein UlaG (beta-lactamase superfamily)